MKNILSKFIILLSILFFQSNITEANWRVVNTVSTGLIWNIQFADSNTVYAVGSRLLMKSNDGGNNWIDLLPNISSLTSDSAFFNLHFLNKDTGFVFRNTQTQNMFRTTDGGATWADVSPAVMPSGMMDVEFVNESVGYAVGGLGFIDSIIARTADGGLTWTNVSKPALCDNPMAVYFITDSIGFTGDEEIYKTTDAGTTWTLTTTPVGWPNTTSYDTRITNYKFLNSQIGYAILDNWSFYKTIDGGNNWTLFALPVTGISGCRSIEFDQNNFGYIVGYGLFQPFVSVDAGNTWQLDGTYPAYYPATCVSTSIGHQVIVGTREGKVVLREHGPLATTSFENLASIKVYPNPADKIINIELAKIPTEALEIRMYDLFGRELYKNTMQQKHTVDVSNFAPGMYIIRAEDATVKVMVR